MKKKTKRKAFNFLRSYFDVFNELTNDKDKLSFLTAIINKQFLNEDPNDLNFIVNLCYESQRHQIETSVKGWERATKDLLNITPPTPLGTTPPTPLGIDPKEEEEEEKEEVKVKEVLSVRKVNFSESLKPFLEKYSKDMLNNFFSYWTEHGEKDKKMKFEKEKSFGISQRLATWYRNDYSPKSQSKIDNPYNLSPAQLESNRISKLQLDEAIRLKNLSNDSK
jgi:hypothetical protein